LKRHTAEDAKKAKSGSSDIATVTGTGSLNDDPSRPNLHHGKPTSAMNETDLPKLTGLPENLHQMVAVSDAVNRDPHSFTLEWDDEAQHKAILEKMQTTARTQLAAHFNRTPKMQFVDVVDADASNRASLLFELRSQNARQFALYRVIASHPDQIFLTGTTQ